MVKSDIGLLFWASL